MRLTPIAAALICLGTTAALAQDAQVPKHACEPKPAYPGLKAMKSDVEVKAFEGVMKNYKECIVAYISQRKSAVKAHEAAESAAAREYNETMAKIRADQEAGLKESEAAAKAKDTVSSPKAPGSKY
jgi:hypothetical protein